MTKKLSFWLKVFISLVVFAYILRHLDLNRFLSAIENIEAVYIVLAIAVVFINRVLMSYKWGLLLKANQIQISLYKIVKIYFVSNFLSIILLPTLGLDFLRTYYLRKYENKLDAILSSIIMERLVGLIVLLLFVLYGASLFFSASYSYVFLGSLIMFILLAVVPLYKQFRLDHMSMMANRLPFINKFLEFFNKLLAAYRNYRNQKRVILIFFLLTCVELMTSIARSYLVAQSFDISISFIYFIQFVPIVVLINRLPISIHGFGVNEVSYIFFLKKQGISTELAFSIGLVDHFCILFAILLGSVFYFSEDVSLKNGKRKSES
jgi:hypothetical protein